MTAEPPRDPIAAFNEMLSEVIDLVMALRQAHRRVPQGHELHAELDQLLPLRRWGCPAGHRAR